jgi:uncharacterized membrane-anchored protein YjiN (DUF445 family)
MTKGRNRIGILSLAAAFAGFLFVTFQPWIGLERLLLFRSLSLRALLAAFFDASLVGGLADWFAVTALFRSPFGIRMPHTDILARNKDAIAEAVPRFLTSFVNEERIAAELAIVDFAGKFETLLRPGTTREGINNFLRARLGSLLANLTRPAGKLSQSVTALVGEIFAYAGEKLDAASVVGSLLRWGQREGVVERLIEAGAEMVRAGIARNTAALTDVLTPLLRRSAGWQGIFVVHGTVERILNGVQAELIRFKVHPDHELRIQLARSLRVLSSRLSGETPDPDLLRVRLRLSFQKLLRNPSTASRAAGLLAAALDRLRASVGQQSPGFLQGVERLEGAFASQLEANAEFRSSFNRGAAGLVSSLIAGSGLIEGVTGYLAGLLKNTDERDFVGRIEDAVWNDLQYIRFNGAAVGGLVGILLAVIHSLVHP